MSDSTDLVVLEDETPSALARWADTPQQAWMLADALMMMHPASKEVGIEGMRTVAQLALLTGANPLPGANGIHVWKDGGKICTSFGIGFWRGERDRAGGLLWIIEPRPMNEKERQSYGIAQGTIAFICSAALRSAVFTLRAQARQYGDDLSFEQAKKECAAIGVGIAMPNDYAKKGRPLSWTAAERAERDLLRKLVPIGTAAQRPVYRDWSPGQFIDDGERPHLISGNGGAYTLDDANADLGFGPDRAPVTVEEVGEWEDEPAGEPLPLDAFLTRAETLPGVIAVAFANGRLRDWANYVTDGAFDPAHADYLNQVLERYCSAVADNGNKHTKAAAEKARADYRDGVTALAGDAEAAEEARRRSDAMHPNDPAAAQPALGMDDPDAKKAALETAQGLFD